MLTGVVSYFCKFFMSLLRELHPLICFCIQLNAICCTEILCVFLMRVCVHMGVCVSSCVLNIQS